MKQRAISAGVISNPYQLIEPGQVFEYAEPLKWAIPIDEPGVSEPGVESVGRKRKPKATDDVGPDSATDEAII